MLSKLERQTLKACLGERYLGLKSIVNTSRSTLPNCEEKKEESRVENDTQKR